MNRKTIFVIIATLLLSTACAVVPAGPPGYGGVAVVPVLPPLVIFDVEPFYYYRGYHYHYRDNRWFYSRSRRGPWADLPRDHYPREFRYRGRGRDRGDRWWRDHDRD